MRSRSHAVRISADCQELLRSSLAMEERHCSGFEADGDRWHGRGQSKCRQNEAQSENASHEGLRAMIIDGISLHTNQVDPDCPLTTGLALTLISTGNSDGFASAEATNSSDGSLRLCGCIAPVFRRSAKAAARSVFPLPRLP